MVNKDLIRLAIHGGAGDIPERPAAVDAPYLAALDSVTRATWDLLAGGGTALEAVVLAVQQLEDCPLFNAGHGAVLTSAGRVEMDASLMDGASARAAAAGAVTALKNPIQLCRTLLDEGRHVMLVGPGADDYGLNHGLTGARQADLITAERSAQLERIRQTGGYALDHDESFGTVGAVARDAAGNLAAATSTGGMTNQWPGRLGDSAIIGAGTWADTHCAVSTTGHGESFIRTAFARTVSARMRFAQIPMAAALDLGLAELTALGGAGGCIAIDGQGGIQLPFSTNALYRGWVGGDGVICSALR